MKRLALAFALLLCPPAYAWQPDPGHTQVPLWPGVPPFKTPTAKQEYDVVDPKALLLGKTVLATHDVSRPTLTVYAPKGRNTGATIMVMPGGGYEILAMDLEGTEICDWLVSRGITAVLLKYRVPGHPGPVRTSPMALADGQRALGLLRLHAREWHLDPHKIGVLGFSAGGHLAVALSTQKQRNYKPVDAADRQSCRPDFAVPIYPGHLAVDVSEYRGPFAYQLKEQGTTYGLNPDVKVTADTPPTFLLQNEDDPVDRIENSLLYFTALRKAKVPVELHIYAQGGHAFGLRASRFPVSHWPGLLETWLHTIGMI